MFRHALPFLGVFGFALLAGCGNGEPEQLSTRPVMVVQPLPASEAFESYPGEVHAFHAFVWRPQARQCWAQQFAFLQRHLA